jgi:hypothetical protein
MQRRFPPTTTTASQSPTPAKEVSNSDISSAIKKYIDNERKKSNDKMFHINYRGQDLALDLVRSIRIRSPVWAAVNISPLWI